MHWLQIGRAGCYMGCDLFGNLSNLTLTAQTCGQRFVSEYIAASVTGALLHSHAAGFCNSGRRPAVVSGVGASSWRLA